MLQFGVGCVWPMDMQGMVIVMLVLGSVSWSPLCSQGMPGLLFGDNIKCHCSGL